MEKRDMRIALKTRNEINYKEPLFVDSDSLDEIYEQAKIVAHTYNKRIKDVGSSDFVSASLLNATALLHILYQELVTNYLKTKNSRFFSKMVLQISEQKPAYDLLQFYSENFPSPLLETLKPTAPHLLEESSRGFFLHRVMVENKALVKAAKPFISPSGLIFPSELKLLTSLIEEFSSNEELVDESEDLFQFLTAPSRMHPTSLTAQLEYILRNWGTLISPKLRQFLLRSIDFIKEEEKGGHFGGGPGPQKVHSYDLSTLQEVEAYSSDRNWMPNVVMIAKSTLVWLDQLSKTYGYQIDTLDKIPDRELDLLAERGFTSLWLIGIWERSSASKKIKNLCGNPEAEASAYSLKGYDIATSIGGWDALHNLDYRCKQRGIKLASDMVPNHTGLDSDWLLHHPERFVQVNHPPFPSYTYNGPDLSTDPRYDIRIEDHYYDRSDAAVTFRFVDKEKEQTSYIFHGNDGTTMPWNDTAQLDFLNPHTREAVIQLILHVARNFHVIRFDAAMTLAKRHVQRLWYPAPGSGGDIPGRANHGLSDEEFNARMPIEFWREVVDRVAQEVPDTLLLAEAFWMMEGYFVRTLGMHRVYNSAFMNMLKDEENKKYRDTIKNTLSFDPEILKRFVNFMNNPDEETAIAQFGNGDKYFGVCTLLATMPGLPMFGHGQIEGFHEKYGMEYQRAYWNEFADEHLVNEHYRRIFPLLKLRYLFSESQYFELFDLNNNGSVVESVFAYVNGVDSSKALVLYNNQYERAQGHIFHSTAKMVRNEDGSRSSRKISLAESLNLTAQRSRFVLYQSFVENLTYIIPSMAIFDEGYWASLNGYEVKILLNIREVVDEDGTYEQLYQMLGGNGTANLENELRAIRLKPLHKAVENFSSEDMISTLKTIFTTNQVKGKDVRKFVLLAGEAYARLTALYESLTPQKLNNLPPLKREVQPRDILDSMESLVECFSLEGSSSILINGAKVMEELALMYQTSLLLLPFIDQQSSLSEIIGVIEQLMVERLFYYGASQNHLNDYEFALHLKKAALLTKSFSSVESELSKENPNFKELLKLLLEEEDFRALIGYNLYNNVAWYKKESFQETIYLIGLNACLQKLADKKIIAEMVRCWLEGDLFSDYKVNQLIDYVN